jgi:nucleoside phosphorylase
LLLTAAQRLARNRLQPGELERPPEEVAAPMDAARRELTTALSLQKAVRDVRAKRTAQRLRKLESGVLTEYPLRQIQTHAAAPLPEVQIMKPPVDFVIVTALDEEREALLRCLPKPFLIPPSHADIRTYFGCEIAAQMSDRSTVTYKVVTLSLPNKGRVEAATATSHAIARWSPRYVLLVGIAGGVSAWGVKLGDILISDQVVDYELQKLTQNGPEVRWQVHRTDPRLLDFARAFTQRDWGDGVAAGRPKEGQPKVHFGPIATGDKVIASDLLQQYRKSDVWPTLIGVEMEAGGAAAAAFQAAEQPGFFMVRGVSDLADGNKDKRSTAAWRQYACLAPAAFTVALLGAAPVPAARVAEVKLEKA